MTAEPTGPLGEPEEWRPVEWSAVDPVYEVSSLGRVRSWHGRRWADRARTSRILKQRPDRDGYPTVTLSARSQPPRQKTRMVHRLVGEAFLGPMPPGLQTCHNDGDRANSRASNLRYGTARENAGDRVLHGTQGYGEQRWNAKLTWPEVRRIRERYSVGGVTYRELGDEFGVSNVLIGNIVRQRVWKE